MKTVPYLGGRIVFIYCPEVINIVNSFVILTLPPRGCPFGRFDSIHFSTTQNKFRYFLLVIFSSSADGLGWKIGPGARFCKALYKVNFDEHFFTYLKLSCCLLPKYLVRSKKGHRHFLYPHCALYVSMNILNI